MDRQQKNFIGLLSAAVNDWTFLPEEPDYPTILYLAQYHGVAGLLSYGVAKLPLEKRPAPEILSYLKKLSYGAAVREAVQDKEFSELSELFEANEITVLPLKGAVIKALYPKAGQRYMSDTDLLIRNGAADKVKDCLLSVDYQVERFRLNDTDIYVSPQNMKYEIHLDISDESFNAKTEEFAKTLLQRAHPVTGKSFLLELPPEEHYAYVLCHFIKHLLDGGIGLRQVMDVYFCRKNWNFDEARLKALLDELELADFAKTLEKLAFHWFGEGESDEVTDELGRYVLGSGTFGRDEQKVADRLLKGEKGNGRGTYFWRRLFPGFRKMRFYYPVLKKVPALLPVMWLWRIIYAFLFRRKKLSNEVSILGKTDDSALRQRAAFYQRCGLNVYTDKKG